MTTPPRPEAVESAANIIERYKGVFVNLGFLGRDNLPGILTTIISTAHSKLYAENERLKAIVEWLDKHGDMQYLYEEGRPEQTILVIKLDNVNLGDLKNRKVIENIKTALTTSKEGKG